MWSAEKSKIARRCGEKHILKRKCTKHVSFGALFEVQMSKNCTPLWRKAHSEVKMLKNWQSGSTFWSSDVEKLHAAVAKSTFGSENVKKLTVRDHFLKFRCRKIARRCGEKHILEVKMLQNTDSSGALFEVLMSKNCTPLWRKAHSGSQNVKNTAVIGPLFEVQMSKNCTPLWRKAIWSENVQSISGQFFEVLMSKNQSV